METYRKIHTNKTALTNHLKRIKQRGGIAKTKQVKTGTEIEYYFPEKKTKTNTKKKTLYDVLSPDGKTIRIDTPAFSSVKESREYFDTWRMQFARRGYWSPTHGLIPESKLKRFCKWITL